jgi:hypothetical protein
LRKLRRKSEAVGVLNARAGRGDGEWVDAARHGRAAWYTVGLAWGLVQLVILVLCLYAGGIAGAYLTWVLLPHLLGIRPGVVGLAIGFPGGVAGGIAVNHNARMWVQRLRLRRLRTRGTSATAKVANLSERYVSNPRGGGVTYYTVELRWTDPVTGTRYRHQRKYRFLGRGSPAFEKTCAKRTELTVRYPLGRPSLVVIDIPFAPAMADLLL